MHELMVRDTFAAAHNLRDYKGKCEHLHGHNYTVEACFLSEKPGKNGLVLDFSELKKALSGVLEALDHKYLNDDVGFFRENNPSAENIAFYIYSALKKKIRGVKTGRVSVWESDDARATYYE